MPARTERQDRRSPTLKPRLLKETASERRRTPCHMTSDDDRLYRYMEALSTSMGVCGSAAAGLGASANVPSINFCSGSLSAAATPCILPGKRDKGKR